jgi:hypothetical protein
MIWAMFWPYARTTFYVTWLKLKCCRQVCAKSTRRKVHAHPKTICGEHIVREVVSHTCVLTIPFATYEIRKETHKVYDWFDVSRTGLMIKLIFFSQPMMENSVASCRRLLRVTVNIGASKSREMRLQSLRSTRFQCYSPENVVKLRSAGSLDTNVPG